MITVLADKFLYKIADFLPDDVSLQLFDSNQPMQKIPDGTQALLIRTVTKINPKTFPAFPKSLSFIGTGSAGTDHVNIPYVKENDITFANAAGCNARSVAEYVAVALLLWAEQRRIDLTNLSVGIIGVGHTGSEVQKILRKLNIKTIACDPPRAERDPEFKSAATEEVLKSDILTFHVPLTKKTTYPTFHWLDDAKLNDHSFSLIINASRGGVVDEHALLEACRSQSVQNYILDVWENEPNFNDETARHAFIETPHIAGYSIQAKLNASRMIIEALFNHFHINSAVPSHKTRTTPQKKSPASFWSLTDILTYHHPIKDYETRFKMLAGRSSKQKREGFNRIRSSQPLRNEFRFIPSFCDQQDHFPIIKKLI